MNQLVRDFADSPFFAVVPPTPVGHHFGELQMARHDLQRCQRRLAEARGCAFYIPMIIREWEEKLCQTLDYVWECQENLKAARRHFA